MMQHSSVGTRAKRSISIEWPTVALAAVIYGGWLALVYWHSALPLVILVPVGAWLICWHSSLQHEVLHGHPTRSRTINRAIGFPPLALWLPYERYRQTHLTHHNDERLTDPFDDPESRYVTAEDWERLGAAGRWLVRAQSTLAGRLVLGPFWVIGTFLIVEARAVWSGDRALLRIWLAHLCGVAAVVAWIAVSGMSLWLYVLGLVIPGTSLMLVRSFAEHKAEAEVSWRTAIVESSGPLALLYLFNNFHALHHEKPWVAWYELPPLFRNSRARLLAANGGLLYRGYGDVFRRFLWRHYQPPVHPLGRAPLPGCSGGAPLLPKLDATAQRYRLPPSSLPACSPSARVTSRSPRSRADLVRMESPSGPLSPPGRGLGLGGEPVDFEGENPHPER
jgi:fatty acid desaturase